MDTICLLEHVSSTIVPLDREAPIANVSRASVMPWSTKLSKKNLVRIVSQNAHGLKSNDRIKEITKTFKIDIFATCLQETWRVGEEEFDINNFKFILYGLNQPDQSRRGS